MADTHVGSMNGTNRTYGDTTTLNPEQGSVGVYVSNGKVTYAAGLNEAGLLESEFSFGNKYYGFGSNGTDFGWSVPIGPLSFGETYGAQGRFGNISIGTGNFGLYFSVEDAYSTGMSSSEKIRTIVDSKTGALLGYEEELHVLDPVRGWEYVFKTYDLAGNLARSC